MVRIVLRKHTMTSTRIAFRGHRPGLIFSKKERGLFTVVTIASNDQGPIRLSLIYNLCRSAFRRGIQDPKSCQASFRSNRRSNNFEGMSFSVEDKLVYATMLDLEHIVLFSILVSNLDWTGTGRLTGAWIK